MKRLVVILLAATSLLPGAASAAGCSPLNCASSQFPLGNGALLGFRATVQAPVKVVDLRTGKTKWTLPAGVAGGNLLVSTSVKRMSLTWYDASRGVKVASAPLPSGGTLAGVSANGTRAVVEGAEIHRKTTFSIVSPGARRRDVTVPGGRWDFDALRGDKLVLIRYLKSGGYQVRLAHVGSRKLDAAPLKDPHESGTIWGSPYSRLASADGRYLFTLYIGENGGAMIHELDLQAATARCIDLPGTGYYSSAISWAMQLSKDGRTLWAASPGYGRVVAIDVAKATVSSAFRISLPGWQLGNATASALSPDDGTIALANGRTVALVDLAAQKVVQRDAGRALALGYAPDGRLWKLV